MTAAASMDWLIPDGHPGPAATSLNTDRARVVTQRRRGSRPTRGRPHLVTVGGWWVVNAAPIAGPDGWYDPPRRERAATLNRAAAVFADGRNAARLTAEGAAR